MKKDHLPKIIPKITSHETLPCDIVFSQTQGVKLQGFTAEQTIALTGCSARQLQYWDETELAHPMLRTSGGIQGSPRVYGFQDLVKLRTIKKMLDHGISLQKIRKAYDYLLESSEMSKPLVEAKLVTDGESIFKVCRDEREILDTLKEGQMVFFVDLDGISREICDRVDQYEKDRQDFIERLVALD